MCKLSVKHKTISCISIPFAPTERQDGRSILSHEEGKKNVLMNLSLKCPNQRKDTGT